MTDLEMRTLEKNELKEMVRKLSARLELLKFYTSEQALRKYEAAVREVEQPSLNSVPNNQTKLF